MKRFVLLAAVAALVMASCGGSKSKTFDPAQVAFSVAFNPIFDNILYPSIVLGQTNYSGPDQQQLFSYTVTAPKDNTVLRVVMDSSLLNYVSISQEILERRGETYTFAPVVKWKYDNLYRLRQQGSVDISFTLFLNDEEVDIKTLRINYRTVNECPLSIVNKGQYHDFRWLFTAFVNEDHPYIDSIMNDMLQQGIATSFNGYQRNADKVKEQVMAVWYYAQNRGITYSSISCTSNPSKNVASQSIRFFDEVYKNKQANCIDACVFFSSILRKIGLEPLIFVEPCHAYLGYYTDKSKKDIALLETTIIGWVNFPELDKAVDPKTGRLAEAQYKKISKYLTAEQKQDYESGKMSYDELKKAVSKATFDKATEYDKETYTTNKAHFADSNTYNYQMLNVAELRKVVQPIRRE